jgi:hypothetical protein
MRSWHQACVMSQRLRLCVFLACIAGASVAAARESADAAPEKERAALLAFLATR